MLFRKKSWSRTFDIAVDPTDQTVGSVCERVGSAWGFDLSRPRALSPPKNSPILRHQLSDRTGHFTDPMIIDTPT